MLYRQLALGPEGKSNINYCSRLAYTIHNAKATTIILFKKQGTKQDFVHFNHNFIFQVTVGQAEAFFGQNVAGDAENPLKRC